MKLKEVLGTFFEGKNSAKAFVRQLEGRELTHTETAEFFNTVRYVLSTNPSASEIKLLDLYEAIAQGEEYTLPEKLKNADSADVAKVVHYDFNEITDLLSMDMDLQVLQDTYTITMAVIPKIANKILDVLV